MPKQWILKDAPPVNHRLAEALGISSTASQLLHQRGLKTPDAIRQYLSPTITDLCDPYVYTDMARAVERIRRAVDRRENVLIYGDYDVDGVTATSILFGVLESLGAKVQAVIPHRRTDGYGLNIDRLKKEIRGGVSLVVTADNGMTAVDEIAFLKKKKIDTIIVDHHQPKDRLPEAILIGPVRQAEGDKELAACGLAFKLGWALCGSLEKMIPHLDLVALGTIADMAPMTHENRILVKYGMEEISRTQRVGLKSLLKVTRLDEKKISTFHIAFLLAPRINAVGRMGSAESAFRLLTTSSPLEADNLARLLNEQNKLRQKTERAIVREAVRQVEATHHFGKEKIILVAQEGWHEGVMGIVAMRLVEKYHRPAIAIAVQGGVGKGSARSIPGLNLFEVMNHCHEYYEKFGGHAAACGLTIAMKNINPLREALNQRVLEVSSSTDYVERLEVDLELPLDALDEKLFEDLARMEPFGTENPRPLFITRSLKIKGGVRRLSSDGFSFWVEDEARGRKAEAVSFKALPWPSGDSGTAMDLVYTPRLNDWNGVSSVQLSLQDLKPMEEVRD